MKIAIYNCFAGQPLAESGLSRRIFLAAKNLGWTALETHAASEINDFDPDFVLALHFFTPKLTRHPTYGCMWSPPAFFEKQDIYVKNVLSYDGFLSSSATVTSWLEGRLKETGKPYFIAPFYTSCHSVAYEPPDFGQAHLLYAGTNWDGFRFQELFHRLDSEPYMEVYGPETAWRGIRQSYKGLIPIDGTSILPRLRAAGAGLCLHRPEHCEAGTPSLRIFEIVASGAVAICQEHPFIRRAFGDSVLYLEPLEDAARTPAEISKHMQWISAHPESAASLSQRAYDIFFQNYTFEHLLRGVAAAHQSHIGLKHEPASFSSDNAKSGPAVDVLIFSGHAPAGELRISLESIGQQDCAQPSVLLMASKLTPELKQLADSFSGRLSMRVEVASQHNWIRLAVRQTSAPYVAILQPGEVWFPDHLRSLIQALESDAQVQLACGGAVRVQRAKPRPFGPFITDPDPAELGYFELPGGSMPAVPRDLVLPCCFLAKRELLQKANAEKVSIPTPHLLFWYWSLRAPCKFTYRVTMSYVSQPAGLLRALRVHKLRDQLASSPNGEKIPLRFTTDVEDLTPSLYLRAARRLRHLFSS